jgi:uncharacterized protein (DUF362 family)
MKYPVIIKRREFLRTMGLAGASVFLTSCGLRNISPTPISKRTEQDPTSAQDIDSSSTIETEAPVQENTIEASQDVPNSPPYLSIARGQSPAANTMAVIASLGGIERFVKNGANVIIKPNICTNYYSYEYAATTNPEVVATLVQLCLGAGAKRVRVMDYPFGGSAESAYEISGIASAVAGVGGEMEVMNPHKFIATEIPEGRDIQNWPVYYDILEADTVINVPIAKHHGSARLTLGGKNLLGVIENRGEIHINFGDRIADLVSLIRPELTVIDATRILMNNGPTGGNLNDVNKTDTIIASQDIVTADSYATTLFGLTGIDISYVKTCAERGLGIIDLSSIKIEEIST